MADHVQGFAVSTGNGCVYLGSDGLKRRLTPDGARLLAAALAARADRAEQAAEDAQVDVLAAVISSVAIGGERARATARAILRAGYRRPETAGDKP